MKQEQSAFYRVSLWALGLLAVAAMGLGCSSGKIKKATIKGTVTYKGQPLQSGILRFVGTKGDFSMAPVQEDGSFIITDVVPDEVKVGFTQRPQRVGDPSGQGENKPRKPPITLPAKYLDPETSGVKYTIAPNTRELSVEFP